MTSLHPTTRFSDKAENYVKYRPTYPQQLIAELGRQFPGKKTLKIADIGSGTGIFSRLLLDAGHEVHGVEPNAAMRKAGEDFLRSCASFHSVDAKAEATGLPSASFDLVTAAQAFHWFDFDAARKEFLRILKPDGLVALVWNNRETLSRFGGGYERFLGEHSTDYPRVRSRGKSAEEEIRRFFGSGGYKLLRFEHRQDMDWDALWGRFLSTSYSPKPGDPGFEAARRALKSLFDDCQRDGLVAMTYEADAFVGRPA